MTDSKQEKEIRQQVKKWKEKTLNVGKILEEEMGSQNIHRFTRDFIDFLIVGYSDNLGKLTKWLIGLTIALLFVGLVSLVTTIMDLLGN